MHSPLKVGRLAGGDQQFVGMNGETAYLTRVSTIVPLNLIVDIVEHHHGSNEVNDLAGRQQEQIVPAVLAAVAVSVSGQKQQLHISARTTIEHRSTKHIGANRGAIHTPIPV